MAEQPHSIDGQNKVSFLKGVSLFPWDWKHIGASANRAGGNANQSVGARVTFTTRSGSDESGVQYGRVLESSADLSVGLKSRDFILALSAGNVAVRSGSDDPKRVSAGQAPAGLKLTLARQFNEDNFIGASYDVRLNKPELSVCWTGETFTEKASLMLTADPLDRTLVLRAALATPGPEWRRMLYNEDNNTLEPVQDDGGRHRLWVTHNMRQRALMAGTQVGCAIDLGRAINVAADFVDSHLERRVPPVVWKIPGTGLLYRLLVPSEDEQQVRHRIRNLELEVTHDFDCTKPCVALTKRFKHGVSLGAGYDLEANVASLTGGVKGLTLQAAFARAEGSWGAAAWGQPSLQLKVEPIAFL